MLVASGDRAPLEHSLVVTIAVADPGGGGGGWQGAQANSDNAKFFIAKYCGIQNNVKK